MRREIGRGAAGVVYLATAAGGRFAAVKVCLREELGDGRYERELRGAKLYKRIPPSEGLVRLLELGECEWGFYTVMELADDEFGARPDHFAAFVESTVEGFDTETVMRLHGMTRDNLYQIRARFTAKLKTLVETIRTEMDEGRFGLA